MPALLIGVDGGGSRTRASVFAEDERVGSAEAGPANPLVVGVEASVAALEAAVEAALTDAGAAWPELAGIGLGVAGAGKRAGGVRTALLGALHAALLADLVLFTDLEAALAGAFEGEAGILVVGGTGSAGIAFDGTERVLRLGGWGRRLADPGSGYEVFRKAALALLFEEDSEGAISSPFGRELLDALGIERAAALVGIFAEDPSPALLHAAIDRIHELTKRGDARASALLEEAGSELAEIARGLAKRLGARGRRVVGQGGLLVNRGRVWGAFRGGLGQGIELVDARGDAQRGAMLLARERLGASGGPLAPLLGAILATRRARVE